MLDKKTKEELMQLPKEELVEVYEMLYELYDELGDRIKKVNEILEPLISLNGTMTTKGLSKLYDILYKGDK